MTYEVKDASGRTLYKGKSWLLARMALDYIALRDDKCPSLDIRPETEE